MASRRPTPINAESADNHQPLRVPGVDAGEVQLGDKKYHFAVHTMYGLQDVRKQVLEKIGIRSLSSGQTTVGDYLVNAALIDGNFSSVKGILDLAIVEKLPEDIVYRAAPMQLIAALNAFSSSPGMGWLETIIKNAGTLSSGELTRYLATAVREAVQTPSVGSEEPSTS